MKEDKILQEIHNYIKGKYPYLHYLSYHVANEGFRGAIGGAVNTGKGVTAGLCDYYVDVPSGEFFGLRIEIKKLGKKVEHGSDQYFCHRKLRLCGYRVEVVDNVGVLVGVSVIVGVTDGVTEFVGVIDGVIVLVGLIDGVTEFVGVIDGVTELVGVLVGVIDGVIVLVGVIDGVTEFVGLTVGVIVGV